MVRKTVVLTNRYLDSVFLMQVARRIAARPGMRDASVVLATPANRQALAGLGYGAGDPAFADAGPNDLVLALEGEPSAVAEVAADPGAWLARGSGGGTGPAREPRSIAEALALRPECRVALISVPGEHAAREAHTALRAGLHVFLFSSNVPVEEELALKREAQERGLLVMGPDCGTAYLGGAGLGFANAVRRGPVGIAAAAGTGMQEFASLVHRAGGGLSSGIGTGGRDLSDRIGGITTLAGIDALDADPATRVVAVLAKPPGAATARMVLERLRRCTKPVVLCLLGADPPGQADALGPDVDRLGFAATIDEAVALALAAVGIPCPAFLSADPAGLRAEAEAELARMAPSQRFVRALFSGGTLCYQAQAVFHRAGLPVHANAPLPGAGELPDPHCSRGHSFIDMGAELFVHGRPHPMIDATLRGRRLALEGEDPQVAVILLDIVLGAVAAPDPAGDLLEAIAAAQEAARRRGGHLCLAASVCGTDGDAQGLAAQATALERAGVRLFATSAQAAAFCREAALLLGERKEGGR